MHREATTRTMTSTPGSMLARRFAAYVASVIAFIAIVALLERGGLPRAWIGYVYLFSTIALYAVIGMRSRTSDVAEYYVAGRRIPAIFNGMATAADWMSAATFLGLAGTLYLNGHDGLAFVVGWVGGHVLVAVLVAPYLRKFGQYTVPDFLGARYGGHAVRAVAALAAIGVSFIYLVAQIYGVGLIASRFAGVDFQFGVFLGLAGVLVCSFLGGMRAITWTQVAQYVILVVAYLVPVAWLSFDITRDPIPFSALPRVLAQVDERERALRDPGTHVGAAEAEVHARFAQQADALDARLADLPAAWARERESNAARLAELRATNAPLAELRNAQRAMAAMPPTVDAARVQWTAQRDRARARAAPIVEDARGIDAPNDTAMQLKRRNFVALVLCLTIGTAGLPHLLTRSYTTPGVRDARASVAWATLFIAVVYACAPAVAVLVKWEILTRLVGSSYAHLPAWVAEWARVDPTLLSIVDLNHDGVVQFAEIALDGDIVMLAMPEIGGLPAWVSGLVAAGGLAAALSTADGLLLTIGNALSHDVYYKMIAPDASAQRRVTMSKFVLLAVALVAAYVTWFRPGNIVSLVGFAFSLAATAFFPALVLGVFWRRANRVGALAGMAAGVAVCLYYTITRQPWLQQAFGVDAATHPLWLGIDAMSSGIFGLPAAFAATIIATLSTSAPGARVQAFVEHLRVPVRDAVATNPRGGGAETRSER